MSPKLLSKPGTELSQIDSRLSALFWTAFVRTNLSNENKGQHGWANKCAQDGYLRPIDCDRGFLSSSPQWTPPLFARSVRGPGDKISGPQQNPRSQSPNQQATLTDLQSVWSGSKDLSVDSRTTSRGAAAEFHSRVTSLCKFLWPSLRSKLGVMIYITVPDFSYNQYFSLFFY